MSLAEEIKTKQKDTLRQLINWFGSQKMTAYRLDVSKQTVSNWVARGRVSAVCAIKAQHETNGIFKKEGLRPDVLEWERTE